MSSSCCGGVYEGLGVRRLINAVGHLTVLGGSIISPQALEAMAEANSSYVEMEELMEAAGKEVARLLGAPAAYITSGACAALALGTAACMAGGDPQAIAALPDTTGLKDQVLIQKGLRVKYDRCVTITGAKLVEVGSEAGTTLAELEGAIGPKTCAIHHLARAERPGAVSLEDAVKLGKKHSVPILLDAAGQVYPVENMKKYPAMGVDLVAYGGKYFGALNSTGLLVGRKDLVEAAATQGFIGFENKANRSIGRPMKVDRQEVIAVVTALREWLSMDHQARLAGYDKKVRCLLGELKGIAGIKLTPLPQGEKLAIRLEVKLDEKALGKTAAALAQALRDGDPRIWVGRHNEAITISAQTLVDGDEAVIAQRVKGLLVKA